VACGGTDKEAEEAAQRDDKVSPGDFIDYEGPSTPKNTEWLLESLNGGGAAEGSDITLTHGKADINVEGGCMGFYIVHELEAARIRVVEPGLQVGRLECGKPEAMRRQAEGILDIVRHLARVEAEEDRMELTSESGEVVTFAPPAPAEVDPALAGTEWLLTSLGGQEPLPETEITLEIDEESAVGSSGCNSYGSDVEKMAEGSIVWSDGTGMTTVGCREDVRRQETRYLNLLYETEAYRIEDGRMEMMNGDGRTTLVFEQEVQ
jgi:heat shock protein HslJ